MMHVRFHCSADIHKTAGGWFRPGRNNALDMVYFGHKLARIGFEVEVAGRLVHCSQFVNIGGILLETSQ